MADPYLYPGTDTLINKLDIQDAERLEQHERLITHRRHEQIIVQQISFEPGVQGYKAIHRHLFQDMYEWAGQVRSVDMSKGNSLFALHHYVAPSLVKQFEWLDKKTHLKGTDLNEFSIQAAEHISELNAIHPFREGNGRVMRLHLAQLAEKAGHSFEIRRIDAEQWMQASIASMHAQNSPMALVIRGALQDRGIDFEQEQERDQGVDIVPPLLSAISGRAAFSLVSKGAFRPLALARVKALCFRLNKNFPLSAMPTIPRGRCASKFPFNRPCSC